jgi:hypothetical protein
MKDLISEIARALVDRPEGKKAYRSRNPGMMGLAKNSG